MPVVTWLGGLFKPQSFLTAMLQATAQQDSVELHTLTVATDLIKKDPDDITAPPREGAYITGLYLEGARCSLASMSLEPCRPKEMFCPLPIVLCKGVLAAKQRTTMLHDVPVYRTQHRADTYVFTVKLRSKVCGRLSSAVMAVDHGVVVVGGYVPCVSAAGAICHVDHGGRCLCFGNSITRRNTQATHIQCHNFPVHWGKTKTKRTSLGTCACHRRPVPGSFVAVLCARRAWHLLARLCRRAAVHAVVAGRVSHQPQVEFLQRGRSGSHSSGCSLHPRLPIAAR